MDFLEVELFLLINLTVLVQFGKNVSQILPPLASQNYLLQSISVKLIYQFLYLIYGYLFFRCFEKVFKEERNENKEGNSRGITTSQLPQKEDWKVKDLDFEILGYELVARVTLTLISFYAIIGCFKKVSFQGFRLFYVDIKRSIPLHKSY